MRVITFSRTFPVNHPRKGEHTYFVEKIWNSIEDCYFDQLPEINLNPMIEDKKYHTIRAGNRWKVGDFFSPRIWSGKPYASKQIQFAPPIEIKKIWHISFDNVSVPAINGVHLFDEYNSQNWDFELLSRNDGLSPSDMIAWFKPYKETVGQIICWNEKIKY